MAAQDDPRVASVLAAYLAEIEVGQRPSRERWLEKRPEIAGTLGDRFDIIELVHDAARSGYSRHSHVSSDDCLPPETVLGEYRLVREIARGGMAIVYQAEQVSLRRRVALKVLSSTASLDSLKLERFRVETQAVAQLNHPHIVPMFAVGSERGSHFYAMQFIEGPTLAQLIRQQRATGAFPPGEARGGLGRSGTRADGANASPPGSGLLVDGFGGGDVPEYSPPGLGASLTGPFRGRRAFRAFAKLAIQAAEALACAHAMGILHRDIKPSNLLVDSRGNLRVTDFGLARFQDEPGLTRTGGLLGTLRYLAPELVLGHRNAHDPRSDGYSQGATLYELLTTRPVFDGRNRQDLLRQIAHEEPVTPRLLDPTIPRDLETIVLKAMDKEPERRYATAQQLADDLRRFLEDKPILARRSTPAERAVKWARRHRAVLEASIAVAFVALAIAAPLLWLQQRQTARANDDLCFTFEQADLGFQEMIRLSDELTMKGMIRYAEAGTIQINATACSGASAHEDPLPSRIGPRGSPSDAI
jgi:serine/threonine protein kinase